MVPRPPRWCTRRAVSRLSSRRRSPTRVDGGEPTSLSRRATGLAFASADAEERADGEVAPVRAHVNTRGIPRGPEGSEGAAAVGGDVEKRDGVEAAEGDEERPPVGRDRDRQSVWRGCSCRRNSCNCVFAQQPVGTRVDHAHGVVVAIVTKRRSTRRVREASQMSGRQNGVGDALRSEIDARGPLRMRDAARVDADALAAWIAALCCTARWFGPLAAEGGTYATAPFAEITAAMWREKTQRAALRRRIE